jgi:hypothetical protein
MMSTDAPDLEPCLAPVRDILRPDGADIEVLHWDQHILALRLLLDSVECAECVLSREHLEQTMFQLLHPQLPSLREIRLTDPREADSNDD